MYGKIATKAKAIDPGSVTRVKILSMYSAVFLPSLTSNGQQVVTNPGVMFTFTGIISMVTGTLFLMWLGERITERGIGNGISLIMDEEM